MNTKFQFFNFTENWKSFSKENMGKKLFCYEIFNEVKWFQEISFELYYIENDGFEILLLKNAIIGKTQRILKCW